MTKLKEFDVYGFLTHAIWHCTFGSTVCDRVPTESDLQAAKILTDLRSEVAREKASL